MSSSTPVGKRVKLSNDAAQSPLGMLAALASPSPPIRNPPQSLATSMLAISGNASTPKPTHSNIKALDMTNTPSIDAGALEMRTPILESGFPERSQRSASPLYSPSTRAARRKTLRGSPGEEVAGLRVANEAAGGLEQSAGTVSSASSVPAMSPVRSGAIPATQLDVLALVTATSPPMPSRRRWAGYSTPKRANEGTTPANGLYGARNGNDSKKDSGSSSDTVSEDEDQLRSHSSRMKARYHSVQMRTLPGTPPVANGGGVGHGARSEHIIRTYPTFYAQGQRQSSATPIRAQVGRKASDGESTTTDEEASAQPRTPVMRRVPPSSLRMPPSSVNRGLASGPSTHMPFNGLAPASEPAPSWRTRPRLGTQPFGVALSKQLAELTEEAEEIENDKSGSHVINQLRDLSASLSPLPSPSQHRRSHPRTKRMRARTNGQRPGSETETDNECEHAAQRTGDIAPRADRSMSTSSNEGSVHAVGAASVGRQRRIIARPQYNGANSLPPYRPLVANGGSASFNGHMSPVSARDAQQLRLPSVAHLAGPPSRQGAIQPLPPVPTCGGGDSGGETTETDDDFFDTSRSFHYSIRPPRRVVRQLASLRERNLQPIALDLHSQPPLMPSYQPHTAPVVGSGPGTNDAFGLGISGSGSGANRNASGPYAGPARIVSTPIPAAAASLASALRDQRRPLPGPLVSPGPPPIRQQPAAYQQGGEQRAYPMHNSSMRREFARDPFTPMPDEFTYKGAALRRLERSHNRGAPGGEGPESSANRKRALTAPSSFEPPMAKRSMHGHDASGAPIARVPGTRTRHSGVSSPEMPNEPVPAEPRHQIGGRSSLLGESPVSSLRSSLFARAAPSLPASVASSSASSSSSSLSGSRHAMHNDSQTRLVDIPHSIAESTSDLAEPSSRKRRHSSAATRLQLQSTTPPSAIKSIEESPTSSFSSLGPATDRSPQSSDALFPPIDSGSN
ncbi:hypothetical protein IW146_006822 [Coemansia sp. RSA 922]|nr:hypothetical protein H4S03_008220 [Coemansia sp. S3946]KAJ2071381.1 hypothetical protein GGH13_003392 [Coemansia sp. S155-1]KAJ2108472.1 hypothetical protein IW146_006822 [Coemansia sp. RSA 922]